jgi:hypothetical protein
MAEFDDRWRRLVAAARNAGEPVRGLQSQRIAELASLARHRSFAQLDRLPRAYARTERRSLVAIAALLAGVFFALLPCSAQVDAFLESATSDLAELPSRVPRPPHPASAAVALEVLPDLHSFLELTPFSTESQP